MKKIKFIIMAFIAVLLFNSCELNDESTISGHDLTGSPVIVGWAKSMVTESYFEDLGTIEKNYPISILGGSDGTAFDSDITINIAVNNDETTAVNGEYTINSSSVVLPAGIKFVNVPIGINTGNFSPDDPTRLVLDISASVDGVTVSNLSKKMIVNFVGCLSDLADFTYNVEIVRENTGDVYNGFGESLTVNGINYFQTASVGTWPLPNGVRFTDICGTLYIESHDLNDQYSNQVTAVRSDGVAGVVDENGNFVLKYNISLGEWGDYTATYTKQ